MGSKMAAASRVVQVSHTSRLPPSRPWCGACTVSAPQGRPEFDACGNGRGPAAGWGQLEAGALEREGRSAREGRRGGCVALRGGRGLGQVRLWALGLARWSCLCRRSGFSCLQPERAGGSRLRPLPAEELLRFFAPGKKQQRELEGVKS